MYYYMNKETGELKTWAEMMNILQEEYDITDDTNYLTWSDYYEKTNIKVE